MGARTANLVRRNGRLYYAQLKIAGKVYRRSLQTEKLDIARIKLPDKLKQIREDVGEMVTSKHGLATLRGCVDEWATEQQGRPDIKASSKKYYARCIKWIRESLPMDAPVAVVSKGVFNRWWITTADKYKAINANNMLHILGQVVDKQVDGGFRRSNPVRGLKRVKQVRAIRRLPAPDEFMAIVQHVRAQPTRHRDESADCIEWLAYSGMRPSELQELDWVDVGPDYIVIRGGLDGTKNRKERMVPVVRALKAVIARRVQPAGPVFYIQSPRAALKNACEKLKLPHMRLYDLRHLFATRVIESGVDFATLAKWLGHSDGGALAARVYGHVRDAHGLEQAKRVEF